MVGSWATSQRSQLSCGIRRRLNIVRILLVKTRVLLYYNHLSFLCKKTANRLDRIMMKMLNDVMQTTIVYYIRNPVGPMRGI